MRIPICVLLILAWALPARAQDGGDPEPNPGDKAGEEAAPAEGEAAEEPAAEPLWRMDERDRKKLHKALFNYLHPGRRTRSDMLGGLEKLLEKAGDGHSLLEDVPTWVEIANECREFNGRMGRRGKVNEVKIKPEVHGFPGGVGTVVYHLYLPKKYNDRELWPVIFCLPDTKTWPDPEKYIETMWTSRSEAIADKYLIVVPTPQTKGDPWTRDSAFARAMITLRHVTGTFDADKKTGGPASDMRRLFVDGDDAASMVAGRFPEMLTGAILRNADGRASGGYDLRRSGGLAGLPAYVVHKPKPSKYPKYAQRLKDDNDATVIEISDDEHASGDAAAIAKWMEELPSQTQPSSIRYTIHSGAFQRHHWITVRAFDSAVVPAASFEAKADRAKNEIRIETNGLTRFELFLNDALVDLDEEVTVIVVEDEKEYTIKKKLTRNLGALLSELVASNHPWRIYPAQLLVDVKVLRERAAAKAAAEQAAAEKAAEKDKDKAKEQGTGADALQKK